MATELKRLFLDTEHIDFKEQIKNNVTSNAKAQVELITELIFPQCTAAACSSDFNKKQDRAQFMLCFYFQLNVINQHDCCTYTHNDSNDIIISKMLTLKDINHVFWT